MSGPTSDDTPPMGRPATGRPSIFGPLDKDFSSRLIAIRTQLANLIDAVRITGRTGAVLDHHPEDIARLVQWLDEQITNLTIVWFHERRLDAQLALRNAWTTLESLVRGRALGLFLRTASQPDVEELIRRPSLLLFALLTPPVMTGAGRGQP